MLSSLSGLIKIDVGPKSVSQRRLGEVLGCATQRNINMMIVRIHRRAAPQQVRQNCDRFIFKRKPPTLSVVTRWSPNRIPDEFLMQRCIMDVEGGACTPGLRYGGLVGSLLRRRSARG